MNNDEVLHQNRMLLRAQFVLLIVTILVMVGVVYLLTDRTNSDPETGRAIACIHALHTDPDNDMLRELCGVAPFQRP